MRIRSLCWNVGLFVGAVLLSCSTGVAAAGAERAVRSPDGKIAVTIHTDGPLGYSITVDGKPALLRSRLGLELADGVKLGEKSAVQGEKRSSADNHWVNDFGKNRNVRDHYNELNVTLKEGDRTFGVIARVYDDGVGLRMVLPKQPGMDSFVVTREATEFTFADDDQVWAGWNNPDGDSPGGRLRRLAGMAVPARQALHDEPYLQVRTAVFGPDGPAYVAITESDLLDWSGMWLVHQGRRQEDARSATRPALPAQPWPERRSSTSTASRVECSAA